jgi:hypothetical protein
MYRMAATTAPYSRPNSSEDSSAPRRSVEGGAAQLFGGGGQGRGAGVVTAEPSWVAKRPQTLRPGRGLTAQRVVAGREDVRTPATPVVALSASSVRRADVRPIGQADVRCPRVRCHPGVRTDTRPVSAALQPRCPHRAGPWNGSVRRAIPVGRNGFDVPPWSAAAWSPARIGPEGKGWCWVGRGWLARGSRADLGRRIARAQAAAPPRRLAAWPTRELVQRQGAGRLAGEHENEQVLTSPPAGASWAGCRRGARPWGWTGRW